MTSNVPENWKLARFGDIFSLKYGKSIDKSLRFESAEFPVVGSAGVMAYTNTPFVSEPTIVIGRKGNVGSIQVFKEGCYPIDTTYYLQISSEFDVDFMAHLLTSLELVKLDSSTATPSLRREDLENVLLVIPPIDEQHKIVKQLDDHLSRLDAALTDVKQAKIKAAQFRRSLLESVFSGKREGGTHAWPLTTIGEISAKPQYGWTTSASTLGDVKLLRTTDLTKGSLNWETVPFCEELPSDVTKYLLEPGDVLISRTGVGVGTSGLIESVPFESVFASYLIRIKVDSSMKPKFLFYFLQSPEYWKQISFLKAGSAISNINVPKIQSIKVPIPSLLIQERVIELVELRFSELNHYSKVIDEAEKQSIGLRRSMLQAAFTGQLTKEVASV
jgi:restriction endonuclease S subunit